MFWHLNEYTADYKAMLRFSYNQFIIPDLRGSTSDCRGLVINVSMFLHLSSQDLIT